MHNRFTGIGRTVRSAAGGIRRLPARASASGAAFLLAACAVSGDVDTTVNRPSGPSLPDRAVSDVPSKQSPVDVNPQTLVGLDEDQIKEILGDPDFTTEQPPSRVWVYETGACSFDLYFYLDLGTRKFRALTYAVRSADGQRLERGIESCRRSIRSATIREAGSTWFRRSAHIHLPKQN